MEEVAELLLLMQQQGLQILAAAVVAAPELQAIQLAAQAAAVLSSSNT
jgi:hypothetical protein